METTEAGGQGCKSSRIGDNFMLTQELLVTVFDFFLKMRYNSHVTKFSGSHGRIL